ncbi:MAG: alpha/beta hydrolase [Bacteroidales bacterium]|nr:alpha/beta hydrolase [Bacteroidales bacterium]
MLTVIIILGIIYIIIVAFFYLFQSNFIFFPQPLTGTVHTGEFTEEVRITTDDDKVLHGWLCKSKTDGPQKLIIYFGGNAEEVSHMIPAASMFEDWAFLLINYPGYGKSEGRPGQKSFYKAALEIYDYAVARDDVYAENIVVMGRSIGSGSAVFLAHERDVKAVVLISPFESIRAVARSSMPFLPVNLILRHKFLSKKFASEINSPMIAFYGTADQIIPPSHTQKLAAFWKGPSRLVELQGYGHNDIFESKQMWEEINGFLEGLDSGRK